MANLKPSVVHRNLLHALEAMRKAEGQAVLWFSEIRRRGIFRDLGYGSLIEYALKELHFSRSKTGYFIQLAKALDTMPRLKESVQKGRTSWTKAREVVSVATPQTEGRWVKVAEGSSRAELKRVVRRARAEAKDASAEAGSRSRIGFEQESVSEPSGRPDAAETAGGATPAASAVASAEPVDLFAAIDPGRPGKTIPQAKIRFSLALEFSPGEHARFSALFEALKKRHAGERKETLVLWALEALSQVSLRHAESAATGPQEATPGPLEQKKSTQVDFSSPYQVVVRQCPSCSRGTVATLEGIKELASTELKAVLCDSKVQTSDGRNRATIPPSMRRKVLARDGYQCAAAGCRHTLFLQVHHIEPRSHGGRNTLENLITLCGECHRWVHSSFHSRDGSHRRAQALSVA